MRPKSKGCINITSSDPFDPPRIEPNSLADESDRSVMRDGVRLVRRIMEQKAFSMYKGLELSPGSDITNDEEIDAWVRSNATTVWHPTGTCRMGTDEDAVVDSELRVKGVSGLRVVDASIMPDIIGGNTATPTVMIAEKASDIILGRHKKGV